MISVFPFALKTAKVVPIFKKDSNLDYKTNLNITTTFGTTKTWLL